MKHRHQSIDRIIVLLRAAALLLAALLGAGCSLAPASKSQALTFAFPNDSASQAAALALIKSYTLTTPGITIQPQPLDAQDYSQQLLKQLDSSPPDLFMSQDTQLPALIARGALLDIQPQMGSTIKLKPDDFQPGALAPWQRGTSLYGLPSEMSPTVMFYNRELFSGASLSEPPASWTWDDWLSDAKKLTETSGSETTRFGTTSGGWSAMIWGNGGELLSSDGKKSLLDSPEAAAGVQFAADLINVHHVAPLPPSAGGPDPLKLFEEQRLAMMPASSRQIDALKAANLPFSWGIAPLPTGKVAANPLSVSGISVSARSRSADAAMSFAGWAASSDGEALSAEIHSSAVPALRAAPARPLDVPGATELPAAAAAGRTLPTLAQWSAVSDLVNKSLVPVWQGRASAAAAYAQIAPSVNQLLAGN